MKFGALVWLAGLSLGAAIAGVSHSLTAMPAPITGAVGAFGVWLGWRQSTNRSHVMLLACGALFGAMLPREIGAPGAVTTHAVHSLQHADLFDVLDEVDADPGAMLGRRVAVSGDWSPVNGARAATVSRRIMTCCAADAVRVGFDVVPMRAVGFPNGTPVRVSGVLAVRNRDGDVRYVLMDAAVVETLNPGSAAGARPSARSLQQ